MSPWRILDHFVGNIIVWLYYGGKKSIDEVAENDNSTLGFWVIILVLLLILFFL